MQKTFVSERGRLIQIVISSHISFRFPNENNGEFYWIKKEDWQEDSASWIAHLVQKNWFSPSMVVFINQSILQHKD